MPVTPFGVEQAVVLRERLAALRVDDGLLASSPLTRARETAVVLSGGRSDLHLDARLAERDFGTFEGWSLDRVREYKVRRGIPDVDLASCWDGVTSVELRASFNSRILNSLKDLSAMAEADEIPLVIVSHGAVIRTMCHSCWGLPEDAPSIFKLPPASYLRGALDSDGRHMELRELWVNPLQLSQSHATPDMPMPVHDGGGT